MTEVIVTVEQGKLKGKTNTDYSGNVYYSFQGIPFGKPPIGQHRFKDPEPSETWEGIRDATEDGSACYQRDLFQYNIIGSEDCLYLNVYTPQVHKGSSTLKPVMFWIHGGAFMGGSNSFEMYGPDYLITEDVVIVATNYRVGLLGFLKLDDPSLEVPGNAGLKDIILALRWVKSNIHHFHGDPNNITVFGESAGSAAVHYLLLSPLSKGLFHKAIMQSGSVFNHWASGNQRNELYAELLNLKTVDEKEILKALQALSVEELLQFQEKLDDDIMNGSRRPYGPCPERPSNTAFLPKDPRNIMKTGSYNDVPILIGYCDREGIMALMYGSKDHQLPIRKSFENYVPHNFGLDKGSEESKLVAQKIKEFYYGDQEPSWETLAKFIELETDVHFVYPVQKTVDSLVQKSKQPIFFYRFCFEGERNYGKQATQCTLKGAAHGDEIAYLFKTNLQLQFKLAQLQGEKLKPGSPEEITTKRLIAFWANFAKFGNPNGAKKNELLNIEWQPAKRDRLNCMNIDTELNIEENPDAERKQFWDELYDKYPSAKFW